MRNRVPRRASPKTMSTPVVLWPFGTLSSLRRYSPKTSARKGASAMASRYDLVIVGMGSGGLVGAEFAATIGLRVAVVERGRVGGDCLWTGCVPSKALLASAKAAHTMRVADRFGLPSVDPDIDTAMVWKRVRAVQQEVAATDDDPARFEALGVELVRGQARLAGPNTVQVGDRSLETRFVLLCTGSRPAVPEVEGLTEAGHLTSESVFELE